MSMQHEFLANLQVKLAADPQIRAAWLGGSLGRGQGDRFSDVDLHLLLVDPTLFRSTAYSWLETFAPLVLFKWMFEGQMIHALTAAGLRVDLWLHDQPLPLVEGTVAVLWDRDGSLTIVADEPPRAPDPAALRAGLLAQIEEFWRCIALLPAVIGRNESLVAFGGLNVELNLVVELLLTGYGQRRERGAKVLNPYLGDERRGELEAALQLQGLHSQSLVLAHLALADVVRRHGRQLAERHGFVYPAPLEEAVLRYVASELQGPGWALPAWL